MSRNRYYASLAFMAAATLAGRRCNFKPDDPAAPEPGADDGKKTAETFAKMREEFSRVYTEATDLVNKAAAENRDLTDDEKKANEKRFARLTTIKTTLDDQSKFANLAITGDPDADPDGKIHKPTDPPGRDEFDRSEGRKSATSGAKKIDRELFARGATRWAATGEVDKQFATITTASSSGILLPKEVTTPITPNAINAFREAHQILGVKPVETTSTAKLVLPVLDATAGGVVSETATSDTDNPPSITESVTLTPATYQSGSTWFSNMELAALDFDILANVLPQLTYSKELGLESAIAATIIADAGITNVITTATTTGFTYANLVDLNNALPKRYNTLKVIVLGQAAMSACEKLVGSDGHPVLVLDPQNSGVKRFLGTPVLRSDYFQAMTAANIIGCVFSLMGFKLRDVTQQNLARYANVPTKPNQTGLNLFAYHAYGYAPSAIATFKTAAS